MNVSFILGRHDVSISRHSLNKKKSIFDFFQRWAVIKHHEKESQKQDILRYHKINIDFLKW